MGLQLVARIEGDALVQLQRMIERGRNLRPLLERIGELIRADILRQFQVGGDPRWAPLSPKTVMEKARMGFPRHSRDGKPPTRMLQNGQFGPANILMRTGALLSSYVDQGDPDHIEAYRGDTVSIGSTLPYADSHQTGSWRMPARPLTITQRGLNEITQEAERYLVSEES